MLYDPCTQLWTLLKENNELNTTLLFVAGGKEKHSGSALLGL
jgi:hypothetical protein